MILSLGVADARNEERERENILFLHFLPFSALLFGACILLCAVASDYRGLSRPSRSLLFLLLLSSVFVVFVVDHTAFLLPVEENEAKN